MEGESEGESEGEEDRRVGEEILLTEQLPRGKRRYITNSGWPQVQQFLKLSTSSYFRIGSTFNSSLLELNGINEHNLIKSKCRTKTCIGIQVIFSDGLTFSQ